MGKASSSKKVARAAGTGGGRTNRGATPWAFVLLIGLIVVIGAALTFTSRNRDQQLKSAATDTNASVAPTVGGTAWNEGIGVYICNSFVPAIKVASDAEGLTTDGDGIIHIAPKVKAAAGKNATLGEFATSIGMTLSASDLQVPGGKRYSNGDNCSGKPAKVYIKQFAFAGAPVGTIETQDPSSIRLTDDATLTIAFVPPADKSKIPAPPSYVTANLKKITSPATTVPTSTVPTTTPTTARSTSTTATKAAARKAAARKAAARKAAARKAAAATHATTTTVTTPPTTVSGSSTTSPGATSSAP